MDYKLDINISVTIRPQDIENLLFIILQDDKCVGDWCSRVDTVGDTNGVFEYNEFIQGGSIVFYDNNNGSYDMNMYNFIQGIRLFLSNNVANVIMYCEGIAVIDVDKIRFNHMDELVQLSIFGNIRYK